jgi:SEL1 protein
MQLKNDSHNICSPNAHELRNLPSFLLLQARELFELAAENKEAGGHYNLGVLYLKGIGVKRDVIRACNLLLHAVNAGQPKAIYQVAKLFQKGIGLKRNLHMVND